MNKGYMYQLALQMREKLYDRYMANALLWNWSGRLLAIYFLLGYMGYTMGFQKLFFYPIFLIIFGFVCSFLHSKIVMVLCLLLLVAQNYNDSPILAACMALGGLAICYIMARGKKETLWLAFIIPILCAFRMYTAVALIGAVTLGYSGIYACLSGLGIYVLLQWFMKIQSVVKQENNPLDLFQKCVTGLQELYGIYMMAGLIVIVMLLVAWLRRRSYAYAMESGIGIGGLLFFILSFVGMQKGWLEGNVIWLLTETLGSLLLAYAIGFGYLVLDYGAVEYTQFEDEEYYYYVKAVPKVKMKRK